MLRVYMTVKLKITQKYQGSKTLCVHVQTFVYEYTQRIRLSEELVLARQALMTAELSL